MTKWVMNVDHIFGKLDINASCDFTCPEEGKWLHDQTGGSNKSAITFGIKNNKLKYLHNKSYVNTICKIVVRFRAYGCTCKCCLNY